MKYETIIAADRRSKLNIRDLIRYKDLILLFVKRDFVVSYKQTILGPLWAIIQPLMTTIVFNVIFGNLARLATSDTANEEILVPGFLFYLAGTICWSLFSQTVIKTANTFLSNVRIFGKVYFPRLIMPVSGALSNLIPFIIRFAMFIGFYLYFALSGNYGLHVSGYIVLLPILILQMIVMGMAFGLIIASATIKYRDLIHLMDFGMHLWLYGTPVAYGLAMIPERYMLLFMLNPVTMVITTFRYAFFGTGYFHLGYYAMSWGVTVMALFFSLMLFRRVERTFMDTI